ncbi:MAG: ribonuclease P protein component [Pseudomonadota bacterium]
MALPASLKKRRDFLAAARARRHAAPGLVLQARRRTGAEAPGTATPVDATRGDATLGDVAPWDATPKGVASEVAAASAPFRVGYTCSKKVGNAVARNRAKRRLRAAALELLPSLARPGWDYVLIGRAGVTADRSFEALVGDLREALAKVHAPRKPRPPRDVPAR